ncbi:response regulator [Metallibacterium sp.]
MTATPIRVLLLEDNPVDARLVQATLNREAAGKFVITTAERLADAVARFVTESFDLVICDLGLPDSDGLATVRAIVLNAPALPLVVLTGSDNEDLGRASIEVGAQDYVVKGETKPSIVRTLRYAIERKRLENAVQMAKETLEQRVAERTAELDTANHALRESEDRYRDLVENNQDMMCIHDLEGKLLWVNQAAARLTGYSSAALLEMNMVDLFTRGTRDTFPAYLAEIQENGAAHGLMRIRTAAGETRWWQYNNTLRTTGVDTPVVRGMAQDVTERKRAEKALRESEDRFRGLVEQPIAGTYIVQDGKLVYVNSRYAEIFGYPSADELIGRDVLSMVAAKDRDASAESMRLRIEGEFDKTNYEFTGLRKDGSTVEVGVHGARATHGGRPAVIGLVQDISEKKHAEEQIQLYVEQLKIAFMSTVEVATTLSEMRDPYTAGHERRVGELAMAIGAKLGLDERRQEGLRVAGYLHDIGKINIPVEILSKPGKLSPLEYELIKGHPQSSFDVLKDVPFPWPIAQVALQHHERMDGSGYPQGLNGEAMLLEARIIAVADVVEAMSSHRPYRPALGIEKALAEIERGRGTAYDSVVVDACLKMFRENSYAIPS